DHPVGDHRGARGERFALALDLDEALAARADRFEQRVIAEPRDLDPDQFGGTDHESALGHGDLGVVDGDVHEVGGLGLLRTGTGHGGHRSFPSAGVSAASVDRCGSNGQPPCSKWARYSSRKYFSDDVIGLVAPSPSAQNARPRMLSEIDRKSTRLN